MIFTLETLKASEGDCLLLHWGPADAPKVAVIDGGPRRTYEESLKPRLEALANSRGWPLELELVMVSHMDDDHIEGVCRLFRDIVSAVENGTPMEERMVTAKRLWLNIFNDILGDKADAYYERLTTAYQARVGGEPNPVLTTKMEAAFHKRGLDAEHAEFEAEAVVALLAGYANGRDLRRSHEFLRKEGLIAAMNSPYGTTNGKAKLLTVESAADVEPLEGLDNLIVGPAQTQIDALQKEFDTYIKTNHLAADGVLAAYADVSAKNLSSIVCVMSMEIDGTKRTILLTGDARGDHILQGLENAEVIGAGETLEVDILKAPHHGSDRNISPDFFKRIKANHYVFSGNGKHGNPDRATLEWLFDARGKGKDYTVYITYDLESIDKLRRKEHEKKPENGPWEPAEHSLKALIEQRRAEGYKFKLELNKPFLINLGDDALQD